MGLHIEKESSRYTTDVFGTSYFVREGALVSDPVEGIVIGGRRRPALHTFLRDFINHDVLWLPHGSDRSGWATAEAWRRHFSKQANTVQTLTDITASLQAYLADSGHAKRIAEDQLAEALAAKVEADQRRSDEMSRLEFAWGEEHERAATAERQLKEVTGILTRRQKR